MEALNGVRTCMSGHFWSVVWLASRTRQLLSFVEADPGCQSANGHDSLVTGHPSENWATRITAFNNQLLITMWLRVSFPRIQRKINKRERSSSNRTNIERPYASAIPRIGERNKKKLYQVMTCINQPSTQPVVDYRAHSLLPLAH